jgi:ubiquinone/menaquinone biosynthesis C-methylase UbiE
LDKHKLFGFTNVDRDADPDYFIRFLDEISADESLQAYKRQTFQMLELREGQRVLDVACGTGADVHVLAKLVAPGGAVVGLDNSEAMVREAQKRAVGCGLPVTFQTGDAESLDFPNNSFDATRADRVFMHLAKPQQVLREMTRVTRPGGRVLVYEVDFETMLIDVSDRVLGRKIFNTWCDGFRNGWLGRHVPALFHEEKLRDVQVIPATIRNRFPIAWQFAGPRTVERAQAAGTITAAEGEAWLKELQALEASGRFFSTLTGFIVVGRKNG